MTITHHPEDVTLLAYAAGALPKSLALVVDAHLEACAKCRRMIPFWEAVGGALLDAQAETQMNENALALALDCLAAEGPQTVTGERRTQPPRHVSPVSWLRPAGRIPLGPGIWAASLLSDRRTRSRTIVLGLAAGKRLPRHSHQGVEMVCVLQGEFVAGGQRYCRGDFAEAEGHDEHAPKATGAGECVCIIGWTAPPRFKGVLGWIADRFL